MADICCLGILVADITVSPVNGMPKCGTIENVDFITQGIGGCAANTAIDLSRLGISSGVIGKVGNDAFGKFMLKTLEDEKVDARGVAVSDSTPSSSAIVMVNDSGERTFLHCPGTNGTFCIDDVDMSVIASSKILFVAGALLMPEFDGEQTAEVLKKAKEMGIYTVLDTAWDSRGRWMEAISPCLPYLDLFIPSIDEARMLSGKEDISEMADVFLDAGAKLCVIKNGKKGCFVKNREIQFESPSYSLVKAKDTNGAGDSFVAGFLTGIVKGWSLEECAKFGNAVGTHCVSATGTTAGIKTIDEVLYFMSEYDKGNVIL